jgi:6-phosphogluconolactonase
MTTDQSLVLASGYSTTEQPGIQAFLFNESTGELTASGSYAGINAPSFLIIHPNKQWVYAVSETGLGSHNAVGEVWAFQMEREPFRLRRINHQTSRGDWPCHLQFDRTGNWLIATNYGSGNAALYPLGSDGSLGEMTDFVQHHGSGPNAARQEGPHAHSSIFTFDNRLAVIADLGIDQLVFY